MPNHIGAADGTVRAAVGPDYDSVDTPVTTDAAPAEAPFAQVLTQRIAKDEAKDDVKPGTKDEANDDAIADPKLAKADGTADAAPLQDPSKDAKVDAAGDAIGIDLAAQLALVSQWPGMAPQGSTQNAASFAAARESTDPLDVGSKLPAVRGAVSKGDPGVDQASVPIEAHAPDMAVKIGAFRSKDEPVTQAGGSADTPIVSAPPTTLHALPDSNAFNALANLTSLQAASAPAHAAAPTLPDALRQMVGTPAWSQEVGNAMIRMAVDDLQSAALRLNPEHLGPLDVQVRVDNGIAHLAFQAAHADTRFAIEASRPMLEQMFAEQGLKIGDCAVGDTASGNAQNYGDRSQAQASSRRHDAIGLAAGTESDAGAPATTLRVTRALGRVDTFA